MTRYIRELRVTIHDMYGNYKNTPKYEIAKYNFTERALGIRLYGNDIEYHGVFDNFHFLGFIRKMENYGWQVITLEPRVLPETIQGIQIYKTFLFIEVRKIEEQDVDTTWGQKYEKVKDKYISQKSKESTHNTLIISPCSCQESGPECCILHSTEPKENW